MRLTVLNEGLCTEVKPQPGGMVIFGASGDLARRKLVPALFALYRRKLLPDMFYCIGCSRTDLDDESFRQRLGEFLPDDGKTNGEQLKQFLSRCSYLAGSYDEDELYQQLARRIAENDGGDCSASRVFYLSTPPSLHGTIVSRLAAHGLTACHDGRSGEAQQKSSRVRVVVEKPFGRDLESAQQLEQSLRSHLAEEQIYRIDHYLGKETVQNIMMLRFANVVFEPVWNRNYIDNVQITVAESLGVERRAGYYDKAGACRDMFQNHMMQLLALVAMEAPTGFDADRVRDERVRLLRAIHPLPQQCLNSWLVRGQYGAGTVNGTAVPAYRDEADVAEGSQTETYVALKLFIDNWRWKGVPFFLRSGKRLKRKQSEIAITFKHVPHSMFSPHLPEKILTPNVLVLTIQPQEGLSLTIQAKHPGPKLCISPLQMQFCYDTVFESSPPDAYERLLLDAMLGDQSLFVRSDEMEISWAFMTPLLESFTSAKTAPPLRVYRAGSDGPEAADELLRSSGHEWRPIGRPGPDCGCPQA